MNDTHDIEMRAWADLAQRLQRELAEARAALRTSYRQCGRFADAWMKEYAAALKAAREDKL